jgi:hypothetical protein
VRCRSGRPTKLSSVRWVRSIWACSVGVCGRMKRWVTPRPTSQSVRRLGSGSVGWPPRQTSLSVWSVSGSVFQRAKALRMTPRTSSQLSRRPRWPDVTSNACEARMAAPTGSRMVQMLACRSSTRGMASWKSSCQHSWTALGGGGALAGAVRGGMRRPNLGKWS